MFLCTLFSFAQCTYRVILLGFSTSWLQTCIKAGSLDVPPKQDTTLWPWCEFCVQQKVGQKRQRAARVLYQKKKIKRRYTSKKSSTKLARSESESPLSLNEEPLLDSSDDLEFEFHQDEGKHASESSHEDHSTGLSADDKRPSSPEECNLLDRDKGNQGHQEQEGAVGLAPKPFERKEEKRCTLLSVLGEVLESGTEALPHVKSTEQNPHQIDPSPEPVQTDELPSLNDTESQQLEKKPVKKKLGLRERVRAALDGR